MLKQFPTLMSDEEADALLAEDLSEYDFSQFRPANFEFAMNDVRINMRLPQSLVNAIKGRAALEGIPYQRYIRRALEQGLAKEQRG